MNSLSSLSSVGPVSMSTSSSVCSFGSVSYVIPEAKIKKEIAKLPEFMDLIKNKLNSDEHEAIIAGLQEAVDDKEWIDLKKDLVNEYYTKIEGIEQFLISVLSKIEEQILDDKDLIIDLDFFKKLPEYVEIRKEWLAAICVDKESRDESKILEILEKAQETGCESLIKSLELEEENGFSVKIT